VFGDKVAAEYIFQTLLSPTFEDIVEFYAASTILSLNSTYFYAILSNGLTRNDKGIFVIELPKMAADTFEVILRYRT
jgi:hypothetical protein